jgi:hypothetical protein
MLLAIDEFLEEFAGYLITFSLDFYASYYQISLIIESRDLIVFFIAIRLVRIT